VEISSVNIFLLLYLFIGKTDRHDITLCDKVCQWLATGRWFFLGTPVSSSNKTDCYDITEILLKVTLSTITLTHLLIGNLNILPLISQSSAVSIHELTLILTVFGQCDVKRIKTLLINTITLVLKVLTSCWSSKLPLLNIDQHKRVNKLMKNTIPHKPFLKVYNKDNFNV
jgi:hypothetical protein